MAVQLVYLISTVNCDGNGVKMAIKPAITKSLFIGLEISLNTASAIVFVK